MKSIEKQKMVRSKAYQFTVDLQNGEEWEKVLELRHQVRLTNKLNKTLYAEFGVRPIRLSLKGRLGPNSPYRGEKQFWRYVPLTHARFADVYLY